LTFFAGRAIIRGMAENKVSRPNSEEIVSERTEAKSEAKSNAKIADEFFSKIAASIDEAVEKFSPSFVRRESKIIISSWRDDDANIILSYSDQDGVYLIFHVNIEGDDYTSLEKARIYSIGITKQFSNQSSDDSQLTFPRVHYIFPRRNENIVETVVELLRRWA
jgi:hypothetical protein